MSIEDIANLTAIESPKKRGYNKKTRVLINQLTQNEKGRHFHASL